MDGKDYVGPVHQEHLRMPLSYYQLTPLADLKRVLRECKSSLSHADNEAYNAALLAKQEDQILGEWATLIVRSHALY